MNAPVTPIRPARCGPGAPSTRTATALLVLLAAVATAVAAAPTFWHVSTQAEFLEGELEHLTVDEIGRLSLAPMIDVLHESTAPFVWTVAAAPAGAVWIGTGDEGRVYRIDADGTQRVFFDAPEAEIHALAAKPDGGLYVGTSPDGQVYDVAPDGAATPLFDPEETYIWSLALAPDGGLFAATGTQGMIYRISADGAGEPFYDTQATHALSLAFAPDGNLLAATESPGRVFRIEPDGRGFVLLDSTYTELRGLHATDDGTVFVAAVGGGGAEPAPTVPATLQPSVTVSTEITAVADVQASPQASAGSPAASGPTAGGVIRIQPDGLWDLIWESPTDAPYDLTVDADGGVVVGTGPDGRIYQLDGNPARTVLLTRTTARQVTTLFYEDDGRLLVATANPGTLLAVGESLATEGTYLSDVRDAQNLATWGTLRWRADTPAGSRVELSTRSGNTESPDAGWSEWSRVDRPAEGAPITSPNARFIQWRAVLSRADASPTLTSVTTAYLPRNLRPRVTSLTVYPAGTVFQEPFSGAEMEIAGYDAAAADAAPVTRLEAAATAPPSPPSLGRQAYRQGLQSLAWTADDPNGDRLQYAVRYRLEGESTWSELTSGLFDTIYVWDTPAVPDGSYVVSVEASDVPSNSPATALVGTRASAVFDVDNTPPRITVDAASTDRTAATFSVQDAQSIIERVEYSLDGSRWAPLFPLDGIADARLERFSLSVPPDGGVAYLMIRATDAKNNTATSTTPLPAP